MQKYDFGYHLEAGTTTEWAYTKIKENKKVLEIGPANGNLAKHLLEDKNCTIDIIEIDEESGLQAKKFANRALIGNEKGNIENDYWFQQLKDERYDYIVLLDVLEHVRTPEHVLKRLSSLLKHDGQLIISVPNIAHNSVIIDLINNKFNYTEIGLLDQTHVHFYTYYSLCELFKCVNLRIESQEMIQKKVEHTELGSSYEDISRELAAKLRTREFADAYQFLFCLKNKTNLEAYPIYSLRKSNLPETLYFAAVFFDKNGTDNKTYPVNPRHEISIEVDLKDRKINQLRFDPLEKNCGIEKLSVIEVLRDGSYKELNYLETTGLSYQDKIVFFDDDPQIYISGISTNALKLIIKYKCFYYDLNILDKIETSSLNYLKKIEFEKKELEEIISLKSNEINSQRMQIKEYEHVILQNEKYICEQEKKISFLTDELKRIKKSWIYKVFSIKY